MTQRTRYFLLGSSLIVFVGLCTGLVAYYNGNLPNTANAPAVTELNYLPADTAVVAYANVRDIMDSQFHQRLRQMLPSGEVKEKLLAETGIDLERDVDSVVAGVSAGAQNERGTLVLVRGRFNNSLIESLATQHGARAEDYKGKRMIVMGEIGRDVAGIAPTGPTGIVMPVVPAIAFVEPGMVLIGEATAIRMAIDGVANGGATKNADLMRNVSEIGSLNNAWVVGRFDAIAGNPDLPAEVKAHLPAMQWVSAAVRIDQGVDGIIRAEASDEKSAEQLRDVIKGALAGAQLLAGQDARVETMVKSLQIGGSGKAVSVAFTVPAEILDVVNGLAGLKNLAEPPRVLPQGIRK